MLCWEGQGNRSAELGGLHLHTLAPLQHTATCNISVSVALAQHFPRHHSPGKHLEVVDQALAVVAQRAKVDGGAPRLEQQQLVKCLAIVGRTGGRCTRTAGRWQSPPEFSGTKE